MDVMADLFALLWECAVIFLNDAPWTFAAALASGITFGALVWWGYHFWARLWNLTFRLTAVQHAMAGVILVLTILSAVIWLSLKYLPDAGLGDMKSWQESLADNEVLKTELMGALYHEISARGLEDMKGIPDPSQLAAGARWEFTYRNQETQILIGQVYTRGVLRAFANSHRLLFAVLFSGMPPDLVASEIRMKTSASPGRAYDMQEAAGAVVTGMHEALQGQIARAILVVGSIFSAVIFAMIGTGFVSIALAAYRDIKVRTLKTE